MLEYLGPILQGMDREIDEQRQALDLACHWMGLYQRLCFYVGVI